MPPRDPELPEGTDQIVTSASGEGTEGTGGFVASGGGTSGSSSSSNGSKTTDKLVNQVREQVVSLRGQAGDKLRTAADDGKSKAASLLDELSGIIEDAAQSIDERLGSEYGDYAHRAASMVTDFTGTIRDKSIDDLLDDTRSIVRKSPGVAIAAAAVAGFALMRVVRTGLDELRGSDSDDTGASGRSFSTETGSKTNRDTTASGGV